MTQHNDKSKKLIKLISKLEKIGNKLKDEDLCHNHDLDAENAEINCAIHILKFILNNSSIALFDCPYIMSSALVRASCLIATTDSFDIPKILQININYIQETLNKYNADGIAQIKGRIKDDI